MASASAAPLSVATDELGSKNQRLSTVLQSCNVICSKTIRFCTSAYNKMSNNRGNNARTSKLVSARYEFVDEMLIKIENAHRSLFQLSNLLPHVIKVNRSAGADAHIMVSQKHVQTVLLEIVQAAWACCSLSWDGLLNATRAGHAGATWGVRKHGDTGMVRHCYDCHVYSRSACENFIAIGREIAAQTQGTKPKGRGLGPQPLTKHINDAKVNKIGKEKILSKLENIEKQLIALQKEYLVLRSAGRELKAYMEGNIKSFQSRTDAKR
mmetsp:Transcript_10768/g.16037  ORF Transcript_10768/g.16037 Transcript_10768/m.16037 type:complete len:267 (+) Transcript_10768:3-803(+)